MYRRSIVFFALVALIALTVSGAEVIRLGPSSTGVAVDPLEGGEEFLRVTVSELLLDEVEIDGVRWAVPRVPMGSNLMERGLPVLPYLSGDYLLDRTDAIALVLDRVETIEVDLDSRGFAGVAPSKGHFSRSIDPETVPWVFDEAVYGGDKPYPTVDVWTDAPFIAGPVRGQSLRIPVARWHASGNRLEVVETMWLKVIRRTDGLNPRLGPDRALDPLAVVRTNVVNPGANRAIGDTVPGRLLVLAYDAFIDEVQPLVDWETLVGYDTMLTGMSEVPHSGSEATAAEIKSYIQSLYDGDGLTWIILVGDSGQIPTLSGVNEGAPCDPCYTKLEGNDNHPDAAISRISAQSGTDVTVQVDKILNYEQMPDTGSPAAWYDKAFGVAGNDTGGSPSYADWERMNFLRDDLLDYTFSGFTELYGNPSATAVKNAVELGHSLGFYIGHGSDTSWGTSGFSVSNVNTLTNGEMLPVIWDVACVNGRFDRSGGDCFAESWLKRDGGGAVSFEAATTNESWVPPCDAQRGVVDSIRLETAFVTGAQHVAGKEACFTLNEDSNSSEGTRFMEQSTLFGSVVMWPRTVAAMPIDPPDDFAVVGGVASLTVKVGGGAFAKANGAIVNFYTEAGGIQSVGSGLIDASGVVHAAVSGDPTHCHIHGHNLLPQSFELSAQADGRVVLDAGVYSCLSVVLIRVADANVVDVVPGAADTVVVTVSNGSDSIDVTLSETDLESGFYEGMVALGFDLIVGDGETLTVDYLDEDTGAGSEVKTATAVIDCSSPNVTAVGATADHESMTISFVTDEPGTTVIRWGMTTPPVNVVSDAGLVSGTHTLTVPDLDPCATIYFEVESVDSVGNTTIADNGGAWYSEETMGWTVYFGEDFDTDPGWTVDNGGFSAAAGWSFGQPTGQGQDSYGGPDPTSGHTGDFVYGVNLNGDAPASATDNQLTLTTPSIDLSAATAVQLSFWRWLGVEGDTYDNARIRMSLDGGPWTTVLWENDAEDVDDSSWFQHRIDLAAAAGHSNVRLQWTYGASDNAWQYCGWNIDDVRIEGSSPCAPSGPLFVDGFEVGTCNSWSDAVGETAITPNGD